MQLPSVSFSRTSVPLLPINTEGIQFCIFIAIQNHILLFPIKTYLMPMKIQHVHGKINVILFTQNCLTFFAETVKDNGGSCNQKQNSC